MLTMPPSHDLEQHSRRAIQLLSNQLTTSTSNTNGHHPDRDLFSTTRYSASLSKSGPGELRWTPTTSPPLYLFFLDNRCDGIQPPVLLCICFSGQSLLQSRDLREPRLQRTHLLDNDLDHHHCDCCHMVSAITNQLNDDQYSEEAHPFTFVNKLLVRHINSDVP